MPATYTVSQGRNQRMSFTGSQDSISVTWHQDYFVDVSGVTASDVDAYDVLTATGVPVVNRSVYTIGSKIIPYVICRDKTATQNPDRLSRWTVKTKWSSTVRSNTEETDNAPIDPPDAVTDITPLVVSELGETEKVLWMDKSTTPVDAARTPAGNFWSEPVMERIPTLRLKITQYEASITYEQMLDRKFKVNDATYRSQAAQKWLIEDVEATEVDVELSGGSTTAALVTYTLALSPHEYGWKVERALFDTQYLDTGEVKLFQNEQPGTSSIGYITSAGAKRVSQTGEPDYIEYERFDDTTFSSFLQV